MTVSRGFRRLGLALVAIAAGAAGVLLSASFFVSADAVRQLTLREIHAVTGLEPSLGGAAKVSLFPSGSISFDDVTLGETGHPALKAERLTARLRFFPLLAGRVEISDIALERPTIECTTDAH